MKTSNSNPVKTALIMIALCACVPAKGLGQAAEDPHPVKVVDSVDLERYTGVWLEIAKIPNRFQKKCARGTSAEYTLKANGELIVVNSCLKSNGDTSRAEGVAKVVDPQTNAKLKVSFVGFLGWRPFWGDYWILGLDEDYRWVVIGTPDRKYGWVLARTPNLDETEQYAILAVVEQSGYDWADFEPSLP